jgi:hypothetical protein
MTAHEEFLGISHQIGLIDRHLPDGLGNLPPVEARPVHQVNDAALIVFHVFALEDFCRSYVSRTSRKKADLYGLESRLLAGLAEEACRLGQLDDIRPVLKRVDEITMIRDLYAHRLGRRKGLRVLDRLTPTVLREYGFEIEDREDDSEGRWWPMRCVAFSACVPPLKQLAKWVAENMSPEV